MYQLLLPELGEGIQKATVAFWHFKTGDHIAEGADVVELVTDKATFNVASEMTGTLKQILISTGKDAPIGAALALIEPAKS